MRTYFKTGVANSIGVLVDKLVPAGVIPMEQPRVLETNQHFESLDTIRAGAIILVILIHVSGLPLYAFNTLPESVWMTANFFDSFSRAAVPLFLMVSGYLLLIPQKEESIALFFRKRGKKILIPYLFFSIFYLCWRYAILHEPLSYEQALHQFLAGNANYHLSFMNVIMGLYLLIPVLRVFIKHSTINTQLYYIAIWFFVICVIFSKHFTTYAFNPYLEITPIYLGYFLLGAYFRQVRFKVKIDNLAVLFIMGCVFTMLMTHKYTILNQGILNEAFYGASSPNVIFLSICSFLLLGHEKTQAFINKSPRFKSVVKMISTTSFGIYLVHVAILDLFVQGKIASALHLPFSLQLTATTFNPIVSIPLLLIVVLTISMVLVRFMQGLPLIKHVVP